ncbi:hypothetical protein RND81_02G145500 [Saponaria officinalis]|uniref:hAT-like transposase RNase-H fold domain-containing protein n=1 Tax=Saponaria officinalis TaxID=3572 RepID=A0AAW1MM49_SAPOF
MARLVKKCMARRNVDIRNFCIGAKVETNGKLSMTLQNQNIDPDEIRKGICMFAIAGAHSFCIVEEPGFKYMVSRMCPSYKVMSRHTVMRDALKFYSEEIKVVEMELIKAPGRIALTSDNWRNDSTQDEYICITAHWIDCEWNLQKRIIRFGALTPPFDGINIGDDVCICLTKWNVVDKISCFTLDNASYNNAMIGEIKRQLRRKDGLKLIDSVVDKIRAIVKHFKHSIPKKNKFFEVAKQIYHVDPKKRLRGDCCVRWNSTYMMLERALYFKHVIDHLIEKDNDLKQYVLNEDDWDKVSTIYGFLKSFYNITNEFSASKTPTSNIYCKGIWEIQPLLLDMVKGPHVYLVDMVSLMQKKFDKYWSKYNLLLSCACVLDPRYKLVFVEYCYSNFYGDVYGREKTNEVLTTLNSLLKEYNGVGERSFNVNVNVSVDANLSHDKNERLDDFGS